MHNAITRKIFATTLQITNATSHFTNSVCSCSHEEKDSDLFDSRSLASGPAVHSIGGGNEEWRLGQIAIALADLL
jgi:hypothetical protein